MNEEQTRALIQEEIRLALGVVREEARERWKGPYMDSAAEDTAAAVLRDVLDAVLEKPTGPVPISPEAWCTKCPHRYGDHGKGNCDRCEERHPFVGETETVPDDPFAPESADQYAEEIRNLIRKAEADGHTVSISSKCCGCSTGQLEIGSDRGGDWILIWDSKTEEPTQTAGEDDPFSGLGPAPHICRFEYMDDDNGHSGSFCMVCGKEEQ